MALNFFVTLSGINVKPGQEAEVASASFGGVTNGSPDPSDVVLELDPGRSSPLLLGAFARGTSHKVVITGYEPNVNGVEHKFVEITLTGSHVISYHLAGADGGRVHDKLHLRFASLDLKMLDTNTEYHWAIPS
jgi:type VI protein secretion system component Hcp